MNAADEPVMTVYGAPWCPHCKRVKKFLAAHRVRYTNIDIDAEPQAIDRLKELQNGGQIIPTVIYPDGTHEVHSYWRVQDVALEAAAGPAAELRSVIKESVAAHLVADVPVSSFLSGGLDSSIVTVLAHQAVTDIDAYTITFRPEDQRLEAMPDDAVYARKVATQFGINLHEIEISPDIVELDRKSVV